MCLCSMRRKISICAIVDASGKADTMVGLFFVHRGSGLTPIAMPVFHLTGPSNGGPLVRAGAQNSLLCLAHTAKYLGG